MSRAVRNATCTPAVSVTVRYVVLLVLEAILWARTRFKPHRSMVRSPVQVDTVR
jgi:hypothetical protein